MAIKKYVFLTYPNSWKSFLDNCISPRSLEIISSILKYFYSLFIILIYWGYLKKCYWKLDSEFIVCLNDYRMAFTKIKHNLLHSAFEIRLLGNFKQNVLRIFPNSNTICMCKTI